MSDSRIGVRPAISFSSETVLAVVNCANSQAAVRRSSGVESKKVQEPTS